MYQKPVLEKSVDTSDDEPDIDIGKLLKDVELFGNYSITVYTTYTEIVMCFLLISCLYHPVI